MARVPLPSYALWTGLSEFEHKLELYRKFAAAGPVDLMLFGDSTVDHGVSAAALSEDLSRYYGRPYRVFNASLGGGGTKALPLVYRLVRRIAVPRRLALLFPGWDARDVSPHPQTPQTVLSKAPAGKVIRNDLLLSISEAFWRLPLFERAGAARDRLFHGGLPNRPPSHLEMFPHSDFGDTMSFRLELDRAAADEKRRTREALFASYGRQCGAVRRSGKQCFDIALGEPDRAALAEWAELARRDGTAIIVVRNDATAGYVSTGDDYREGVRASLAEAAVALGGVPVVEHWDFQGRLYEISEERHFNVWGATRVSHHIAAALAGKPSPPDQPPARFHLPAMPWIEGATSGAMTMKPAGRFTTLHLKLHTSWRSGVWNWNAGPPMVALQLADGRVLEAPAQRDDDDSSLRVRFGGVPEAAEANLVRVRTFDIPLAAAWWTE